MENFSTCVRIGDFYWKCSKNFVPVVSDNFRFSSLWFPILCIVVAAAAPPPPPHPPKDGGKGAGVHKLWFPSLGILSPLTHLLQKWKEIFKIPWANLLKLGLLRFICVLCFSLSLLRQISAAEWVALIVLWNASGRWWNLERFCMSLLLSLYGQKCTEKACFAPTKQAMSQS